MSTLTRRPSGNRVPDYKDYMSFVSAYRNGKKEIDPNDDQNFIISTNNERNVTSDISAIKVKPCDSYSSFLEKTKSKKFSSVKPPAGPSGNEPQPKQTVKVKTEIFLEINDDIKEKPNRIEIILKEKDIQNAEDETATFTNGQVEARKKMFEGRTQPEHKISLTNGQNQKNKILILKQQLESNTTKTNEEHTSSNVPKEIINKINIEKFETFSNHHKTETDTIETIISVNSDKPNELSSTNTHNGFLQPQLTMTDGIQNHANFHIIEKRNNELQADVTSKEKLIDQLNETLKFKTSISLEPQKEKLEEVTENIPIKNVHKESSPVPPPPPPPMPNGFGSAPTINKIIKKTNQETSREKDNISPPNRPASNCLIQEAELENSRRALKNQKSSTLERTNPMVRKLAYGAMLDMYGAYHDKANSYVSTLPRHHVKKDNGLQKIIDSIAAQGGLDKLSGRSNPKAENE